MPREARKKILIADDNEINQRIAHAMLSRRGYALTLVSNGAEAIRALEQEHFDLLILDCLMPGLDGFATARRIREAKGSLDSGIPILAITALAAEGDRDKCLQAGMDDYISKPYRAETLFARIEALLHGQGPGDESKGVEAKVTSVTTYPGLQGIVKSMSGMLARDSARWESDLERAFKEDALESLRLLAHKIRGTADIVGNGALSDAAKRLEECSFTAERHFRESLVNDVIAALRCMVKEVQASG